MINKIKTLLRIKKQSTKKTMDSEQAKLIKYYTEKYGCWHNWRIRKICMKPLNRYTCLKCGKIEIIRIK